MAEIDPWMDGIGQGGTISTQADDASLVIETIEGIVPLDDQFGVFPKKTVPDALHDALLGQPEPLEAEIAAAGGDHTQVPPLQLYAILDAAKVDGLADVLENSELEHRCLFQGEAYDELKDVAPWIVRLEEGNDFTRHLFTHDPDEDVPWYLWDKEPGIFIRSRASLEQLRGHFRTFTKLRDKDGKWFYLRFWDPQSASTMLDQTKFWESLLNCGESASIIVPAYRDAHLLRGKTRTAIRGVFDFEKARDQDLETKIRKMADDIRIALPLDGMSRDTAVARTRQSVRRMMAYGFLNSDHLRILASWELVYGPGYESRDPDGTLAAICAAQLPALKKFKKFKKRMSQLRFAPEGLSNAER